MKRVLVFFLALVVTAPAFAQKAVSDGVAVIVNDSIITYQDVEQYIGQAVDLLARQYGNQPEAFRQRVSEARQDGTEQLVERQLIIGEFKTAGYNFPEAIIEDTIQERIQKQFRNRVTLMQSLREQGITYETYRQRQRDEIVVDAMRRKSIPTDVIISPQKIVNYYEQNKTNYLVGDQVKLRMIVLNKAAGDKGAAKELAGEIDRKITEGAAFIDMAKIHSDGPQRANGGDWGWAGRDTLRPELAEKAFSLKTGERSGVIELPDSCWLVLVEEARPAHARPLLEVQDEIERTLRLTEASRVAKKWVARLKSKAFVRYF